MENGQTCYERQSLVLWKIKFGSPKTFYYICKRKIKKH